MYEVQLYALSEWLPFTSRRIYGVFLSSSPSFRSRYLLGRILPDSTKFYDVSVVFTKVLRYPLCNEDVFRSLRRQFLQSQSPQSTKKFDLPRRLFRPLISKNGLVKWRDADAPLPFLRCLYEEPSSYPLPDVNAHDGYALTKAVYVKFLPLIRFLLNHGADPRCKNSLAVNVAIRQKDVGMVRFLVERNDSPYEYGYNTLKRKRRKLEDRVEVNRAMLRVAVKCDAREVIDYLTREKGCIPDMQTLHMMTQ